MQSPSKSIDKILFYACGKPSKHGKAWLFVEEDSQSKFIIHSFSLIKPCEPTSRSVEFDTSALIWSFVLLNTSSNIIV